MYTITDLAKRVGQPTGSVSWAIKCGLLPAPDILGNRRRYYSGRQLAKAAGFFKSVPDGQTATTLCKVLGISLSRFQSLRGKGLLPAPAGTRGKREVFTPAQIQQIKESLPDLLKLPHKREPEGYYSGSGAAELLDVPRITFQFWQVSGAIPRPTRLVPGCKRPLYSAADVEHIRASKAEYFAIRDIRAKHQDTV